MSEFFILSLKWTKKKDPYITFWGPDNSGYRWAIAEAGRYSEAQIYAEREYYDNRTDTLAVPCKEVEKLVQDADPKRMDQRPDMRAVRNSKARLSLLKAYAPARNRKQNA